MMSNESRRARRRTARVIMAAWAGFLTAALLATPSTTWAIPAFARATGLACSGCHTAWPKLNRFGRAFKENGYTVMRGQPEHQLEIGSKLSIPSVPPVSFVMNFRPYDRSKGGPSKVRVLHELEILFGGAVFNYGSVFGEIAAEDESGFDPTLQHAWGGFHPHQAFNVIGGYGNVFAADPYNTLAARHITRGRSRAVDLGYQTGVNLHGSSQFISVYGREPLWNKLFYLFTFATDRGGDFEGEGSSDYTGRMAFDITKELTIGAFGIAGREDELLGNDRDFWRAGGDLQAQYGPINLQAVGFAAEDDLAPGSFERNDGNWVFSTETYFVFDKEVYEGLPDWFFKFVPTMRLDWLTIPESSKKQTDLVTNITYYPLENVRLAFEYAQQVHGFGDARRFTLFGSFAF